MRPFVVNVADLLHRPGSRRRERLAGRLDRLAVGSSQVPASSEVGVEALLEWVTEGVLASGSVSARFLGECRRCLGPVDGRMALEFRELFEEHPREGESYPLRHEILDLEPLVREALLLELPLAPLCADACRGLCPTCGVDRSQGECHCPGSDRDLRWAALDVLLPDRGREPG